VLAGAGKGNKVLVGKDTRISGYLLESALEAGFSAAGVDISLLGPMPTPGIAYLTRTARACAGVVISASHNPYHDNGIKIFSAEGTKLDDALVAAIDRTMQGEMTCVESSRLGRAERFSDAQGRYIEFCKNTFPRSLSLSGLKVVIDCANGAGYEVAPRVLAELGVDVVAIDWTLPLSRADRLLGGGRALQGNLDPAELFGPPHALMRAADAVLAEAEGLAGHIFSLGHGIDRRTDPDQVARLVEHVHERGRAGAD